MERNLNIDRDETRSTAKAAAFNRTGPRFRRKTQTYDRRFPFPAKEVFPQFCPTRELDWIEGWDCQLLYTGSGYVEEDCIFSTDETNPLGPGLWIFTRYQPDEKLELVRVINGALVIHFRIALQDGDEESSTWVWRLTFTALSETGNDFIDSLAERSPAFEQAIDGLGWFLEKGQLMVRPD